MRSVSNKLGIPYLPRFDQQGQSLVQVMISAAIMAVIMLGFASMQEAQQKANLGAQITLSRHMLQMQIQQAMMSPGAMTKTLADSSIGNVSLKNCLTPSGSSCVAAANVGFKLHDGLDNVITGDGSTPTHVLRYDYQGSLCGAPSPQCLFEVFAQYTSTCPAGSPCSNPSVNAVYTIQQASGVTPAGGSSLRSLVSPPIALNALGGGFSVSSAYSAPGSLGSHAACFLTKTVVSGGGAPGCTLAGTPGGNWTLTVAGASGCEATCIN